LFYKLAIIFDGVTIVYFWVTDLFSGF